MEERVQSEKWVQMSAKQYLPNTFPKNSNVDDKIRIDFQILQLKLF